MPMYAFAGMVPMRKPRGRARVGIKPGKAFNNFGAIADAFPEVLSEIVVETTELLGNVANAMAPTQQDPRPSDPEPGTLKRSKRTRFYKRRGSDLVQTGRVEWPAVDRRGHRFALPLETGSLRRGRQGKVTKGSGWLVDAVVPIRARFVRNLQGLEARLAARVPPG